MTAGYPVVKIRNITSNRDVSLEDSVFIPENIALKTKEFWLKDGELVMAMTGATVGKFGLIVNNFTLPCVLNQRVAKFSVQENQGKALWFLYCTLCQSAVVDQIISQADGSAQANIK